LEYEGIADIVFVTERCTGATAASIVDPGMTQVLDGDLAKVMRCYDNERRYAHQVLIEAIRLAAGRRHEAVS